MNEKWLPKYQKRFPMPDGDPEKWNMDQKIVALIHNPRFNLSQSHNIIS